MHLTIVELLLQSGVLVWCLKVEKVTDKSHNSVFLTLHQISLHEYTDCSSSTSGPELQRYVNALPHCNYYFLSKLSLFVWQVLPLWLYNMVEGHWSEGIFYFLFFLNLLNLSYHEISIYNVDKQFYANFKQEISILKHRIFYFISGNEIWNSWQKKLASFSCKPTSVVEHGTLSQECENIFVLFFEAFLTNYEV